MIDIYKRHFRKDASDQHYLRAAKLATVFWGLYAVTTAGLGRNLGSLIEAVNILGSLFYGGLLGVFVLAAIKRVTGNGAFYGVIRARWLFSRQRRSQRFLFSGTT